MGKKRPLNGVRKCDGQTNTLTFKLIDRIGPEGRFFENSCSVHGKDEEQVVFVWALCLQYEFLVLFKRVFLLSDCM